MENENNIGLWNNLKTPPPEALKKIKGGRLKGMTDISPQWRYQALTDQFGPCGVGWKYEITKLWMEPDNNGLIAAFATIDFQFKHGEKWSDRIPGIGGSMFIAKESSGPRTNDEAYKMAVTDALSVAMKMIGVASDVYMGNMDGSKYRQQPAQKTQPAKSEPLPPVFSKEQQVAIDGWKVSGKAAVANDAFKSWWEENKPSIIKECSEAGAKIVYQAVIK